MYIQRVVLENLKGFRSLDFSFARPDGSLAGWTVLTGDNGSGKTAILKAIALALVGPDVGRALQPSLRGWIREGCSEARIEVQIHVQEQDKFTTGRRADSFWSEIELQKNGGPEVSMKAGSKRRGKKRGPLNGPWADNTGGWFAAGYGPFRRLYGASPEAQRLMSGPNRVARFATMFKEDATLLECELWLKDLNHKSLESHPREQRVLQQVCDLLNDDFLRNGLRVERVDSDGLWLRDSAGTVLSLSDMSEGYRAALALMIDILRHMDQAYGDSETGEITPRWDPDTGAQSPRGIALLEILSSLRHQAVTEGRRRAYLRLERALRSFLAQNEGQGASASEESIQDFLASVDDAIDYGLSAWFFLRDGQAPEPFQTLRLHFPSVWNRA